jgi:glycosyltransferase involved in cell wall biosynthesis
VNSADAAFCPSAARHRHIRGEYATDLSYHLCNSVTKSNRIRVVHLVSTLNIGGLEKVVYDLVRQADHDRFDMRVVCLGEIGALAEDFRNLGVPVQALGTLGKKGLIASSRILARLLSSIGVDVLHTHNPMPHMVGALSRCLTRIPVLVHTKHGRNYPGNWKRVLANRIVTWLTDCVVAVSNDAAAVSRDIEHVHSHKLRIIQNGIDLEKYRTQVPHSRDASRVIHVARLSDPPKDHTTLLHAAKIVAGRVADFHLEIVGDGPDRGKIESLCDELQLRKHVTFSGFCNDIRERLARSGMAMLSSTTEGLSITLLEAMAMSLPVVATDVGGNREVVADGKTGLLVPQKDPARMAQAMLEVMLSPNTAEAFGIAGRKRAEESFCLNGVASKYAKLYEELWHPSRGRVSFQAPALARATSS